MDDFELEACRLCGTEVLLLKSGDICINCISMPEKVYGLLLDRIDELGRSIAKLKKREGRED